MKFFLRPKGRITSRFANTDAHRDRPHTGIDWKDGYKRPQRAMRGGLVYKVREGDPNDIQQYRNVHMLCETALGPMEVAYVHCHMIIVDEGDRVLGGQYIYFEGNSGTGVYSGGVQVLPEEKWTGKGSHSHISVRPVKRVPRTTTGMHYLRQINGQKYKDENGNYFEITNYDNGSKGWVDWEDWIIPSKIDSFLAAILSIFRKDK